MSNLTELEYYLNRGVGNPVFLMPPWGFSSVNQTGVANRVHFSPVWVPKRCVLDKIMINIAVASAGKNCRLALNADNGKSPYGGALLFDSGDISVGTIGPKSATLPDIQVNRGIVWVAIATEDATQAFARGPAGVDISALSYPMLNGCYYTLGAWGPLTNPCPVVTMNISTRPLVVLGIKRWIA